MKEEKKSPDVASSELCADSPTSRTEAPHAGSESVAGAAPEPVAEPSAQQPERRPFPTLVDLLVFLGMFLVANLVGLGVALLAGYSLPDMASLSGEDATARLAAQIELGSFNAWSYFVSMSLTLVGLLVYRSARRGPHGLGHFSSRGVNPALLLWGVLFMCSTSVVLEPLLDLLPEVPNVYGRGIWAVITLVVMAPLFEEVIFRGVLLDAMRRRYGLFAAWLLSALLFGVVHAHPTVAVNAFFMGLILGFVYIASDSLWATIFLHAVNNGIAYVLLAAGLGDGLLSDQIGNRTLYAVILGVAAAIFLVSGAMMLRTLRRMRREERARSEEKNRAAA